MKTAEEILKKHWNANDNNHDFDDMYVGEHKAILDSMKEFALEVAKEALRNAAEVVNWNFNGGHDCKQAILSENNIPKL